MSSTYFIAFVSVMMSMNVLANVKVELLRRTRLRARISHCQRLLRLRSLALPHALLLLEWPLGPLFFLLPCTFSFCRWTSGVGLYEV